MTGVTCLLDIVNPWFPHVDSISVLWFSSYCLSWKTGNTPTVESDGVCPMSLPGFRGGRRAAQRLPSEHSLHQGQPHPEALFLDVQKPFLLAKASQSFLLCSFFHGLMVEDSLFPPRPAPSPASAPGDPAGLAMMGGCGPHLAVAPHRPRGFGQQLSPGLRAPSDPTGQRGEGRPSRGQGNTAPSQAVGCGPLPSRPEEGASEEAEPCPSLAEVRGAGEQACWGAGLAREEGPGAPASCPPPRRPDPSEIPLIPQPRLDSVPII